MNHIVNKTWNNNNYMGYDYINLFQNKLDKLFENISVKHSHVFLASKWDSDLLIALNKVKYKDKTHISRQHYFDKLIGVVYRKDMNQFVAQTFEQMYLAQLFFENSFEFH